MWTRERFSDRRVAGMHLAAELGAFAEREDVVVLALPRGGVPVGWEVARALGAPLDVLVVRKLGLPGHEELAMGAIASGGVRVINPDVVNMMHVPSAAIDEVVAHEIEELHRREQLYRGGRPLPDVRDRTVILVDDGVATGSTMLAAIRSLRTLAPRQIVVAVPVASVEAAHAIRTEADTLVVLSVPETFDSVGRWYADFRQTSDAEVRMLLTTARDQRRPGVSEPLAAGQRSE